MKFIVTAIVLLSASSTFAFEKKGPCADAAATAALKYASKYWRVSEVKQRISFSDLMPSSNPAPVQIYDVGIIREDNMLVQFDVALDYSAGRCSNFEVRFAETAD